MKLHVKIGTHPASYAEVVQKKKPPKVGDRLELKNKFVNGKSLNVRCTHIKDLGNGDILYYMELE